MSAPPPWLAEAQRLQRTEGLSFSQIAERLGLTRGQVGGAMARAREGPAAGAAHGGKPHGRACHMWTEEVLTERWEDRKARRQAHG